MVPGLLSGHRRGSAFYCDAVRVLLLEDDPELGPAVAVALRRAGLAVDLVATLAAADLALSVHGYDTAVFDRMVPDGDALDLVRVHRGRGWSVPVLFLTARDRVEDRVDGFHAGGDDYLVKPFAVRRAGVQLTLTPKEFAVLELLVARAGTVVSRTELITHCWDEMADPASNVVDVVVAQLRRKLGDPPLVATVRGAGYRVDAGPVSESRPADP